MFVTDRAYGPTVVGDLATLITFLTDLYLGCPLLKLQTSHPISAHLPPSRLCILYHTVRKADHLLLQVLLWFPNHQRKSHTLTASKAPVAYFLILNCCSLVTSALTD